MLHELPVQYVRLELRARYEVVVLARHLVILARPGRVCKIFNQIIKLTVLVKDKSLNQE